MGRKTNKRKHADANGGVLPDGRRQLDHQMSGTSSLAKKPRLSPDPAKSDGEGHGSEMAVESDPEGWHLVGSKSKSQKRKGSTRDDSDGTSQPRLVYHGKNAVPISIADLQNLVLYTLVDGVGPSWVAFNHAHDTKRVVVLMVPGLEKEMFDGTMTSTDRGRGEAEVHDEDDMATAEKSHPISKDELRDQHRNDEFDKWKNGSPPKPPRVWLGAPTPMVKASLDISIRPMAEIFSEVWPVKAPGDSKFAKLHSPIQAMLIAPIPHSKDEKSTKGPRPPPEERSFRPVRTPIMDFVHSADELREAEYPVHPAAFTSPADAALEADRRLRTNQSSANGWVDTSVTSSTPFVSSPATVEAGSITSNLKIYALDCEMVLTEDDVYSLARISLVSWSGATVLDSFVKPTIPIKNYFTQFSGITPALLQNVTTTLADVQKKLVELFDSSTILLGHSLESDLNALKMTHPFIVDTSLVYPHPRGPPLRSSLKFLSQKYLKREIQKGGEQGHDSVEDALAVLDLVKLKCEKGPKWGTNEAGGEPIFRRLARATTAKGGRTSAIVDYGTPERGYGKEATQTIGCTDDDAVVAGVIRAVNGDFSNPENGAEGGHLPSAGTSHSTIPSCGVNLTWARLRELESFRGWCNNNNNRDYGIVDASHSSSGNGNTNTTLCSRTTENSAPDAPPTPHPKVTLSSHLALTTNRIRDIHASLPPRTLFIVYSGTGDPREVGRLQKMQSQFRREFKVKKWDELTVKWTDVEEQMLRRAVEQAREGCAFMCVT